MFGLLIRMLTRSRCGRDSRVNDGKASAIQTESWLLHGQPDSLAETVNSTPLQVLGGNTAGASGGNPGSASTNQQVPVGPTPHSRPVNVCFSVPLRIPRWAELPSDRPEPKEEKNRRFRLLVQGFCGFHRSDPKTIFTGRIDVCPYCKSRHLAVFLTKHIITECPGWSSIGEGETFFAGVHDAAPEPHWEKD